MNSMMSFHKNDENDGFFFAQKAKKLSIKSSFETFFIN